MGKKPIKEKWFEDALTIEDLGLSGLKHHFDPAVRYSTIDINGGRHNKARENPHLDEEHCLDLAGKMEAGHPFRAVTLFMLNDGIFVHGVAHGNHRLRSYALLHNDDTRFLKSAQAVIGAHVIESPYSDDVEEYERLANAREGRGLPPSYQLNTAIWLVQHRKMSKKGAFERTGISAEVISGRIIADRERQYVETMGVETHNLTPTHLKRLASLTHDSHKKHLATLANDGHITSEDLSKMVTHVKKLRTEAKGNEYIHDEYNRTRRERCGPKNDREPPEQRRRRLFLKGLRQFEDLWLKGNDGRPIHSLNDVGISPQDRIVRQEIADRARELVGLMQKVMRLKNGGAK